MPNITGLMWLLAGTLSVAQGKLPEGVAMYWGADRPAHGWRDKQWQKGGTGRIHHDSQVKKHGYAAIRMEGIPEKGTAIGSDCVPAVVDPSKPYVLRFWSRRTGDATAKAEVRVFAAAHVFERRCKPIAFAKLDGGKGAIPIPMSDAWHEVTVPLDPLPAGANRLIVIFAVTGRSTVWIDEATLAEKGVEVPLGGRAKLTDADYAGIRFADNNLPANILRNPGFEDSRFGPWRPMNGDSKATLDSTKGATGSASLRFDAVEFAAGGVYQRVSIDPRRRYRLSLKASCDKLVGYLFTKILPFNRYGGPTGWVGGEILVTGTTDGWVGRSIEFQTPPGSKEVVIYLRVADTMGKVWVDDVVLAPLPLGDSAKAVAP